MENYNDDPNNDPNIDPNIIRSKSKSKSHFYSNLDSNIDSNILPINTRNKIPKTPKIPKSLKSHIKSETNTTTNTINKTRNKSEIKLNHLPNIFYKNYFKYSISLMNNNLKSKSKKKNFNYIAENSKYQNALDLLTMKSLNKDDINGIKFISSAKVKSKLLISQLINDNNTYLFFSKNKEKIKEAIDILYDKHTTVLSPIIEEKSRDSSSSYKKKYGGIDLTPSGNNFLSILSTLDCKHDFVDTVNSAITRFINATGTRNINAKIANTTHRDEINELFNNKKQLYEEDIINNSILHILGHKQPEYYPDNGDFSNFAYIDMNDTADKLDIYEKLNITPNITSDVTINDVHDKLIEYIKFFYRFDNINFMDTYKYLLDTDVKLYDKFEILNERHKKLYDKLGKQLYPFENAFDPHSSNKIEMDPVDEQLYIDITNQIFNYDAAHPENANDYKFAINKNVNKYFGFTIHKDPATNIYFPCIIFKRFVKAKMNNTVYKHLENIEKRPTRELCTNTLMRCASNLAYFHINATINQFYQVNNCTYIENRGASFNTIDNLKIYILKLIAILTNNPPNHDADMQQLLNIDMDTDASITDLRTAIIHHMVAYVYYCYENPPTGQATPKDKIETIIQILFDLKKSGDWGQALFCSKYNDFKRTENKECFFITGDRLAATRAILTNNVKTIFPIEYKLLSNVSTIKKKSILTLYRNNFNLTFENLIIDINNNLLSLAPFKHYNISIHPLFFMKQEEIALGKKQTEIITMANFNFKTYEIFMMHIYIYLYVFIHIYTIVNLDNNNHHNINYDAYEDFRKEAQDNIKNYEATHQRDRNLHTIINDLGNQRYNHFNLLNLIPIFKFKIWQEFYLANCGTPDKIARTTESIESYFRNISIEINKIKIFIKHHNDKNKSENKFNTLKVFELFIVDIENQIIRVVPTPDTLLKHINNISNLAEIYSLLLCDDKFTNDFSDAEINAIKNNDSKTAIKKIFDFDNMEIDKFLHIFNTIYSQPSQFKKYTKEVINSKLIELTNLAVIYSDIKANLDILREHIAIDKNIANETIVYLKSSFSIEDVDFINIVKSDFAISLSNSNVKDAFDKIVGSNDHYQYFITTNNLYKDLYAFYSSFILPYKFISKSSPAIQGDPNKINEIAKALTNLYTNELIIDLFSTTNAYIPFDELDVRLHEAMNRNNVSIEEMQLNLQQVYDIPTVNDTIYHEFKKDRIPRVDGGTTGKRKPGIPSGTSSKKSRLNSLSQSSSASPSPPPPPPVAPIASASVPKPRTSASSAAAAPIIVRGSRPIKDTKIYKISDTVLAIKNKKAYLKTTKSQSSNSMSVLDKSTLIALYKKLKKSCNSGENFYYNKEIFIHELRSSSHFLKPIINRDPGSRDKIPNDILADIGFIMYILTYFENILKDRPLKMFKSINKFFNVSDNIELIKYIKEHKLDYYFNSNYVIIPIIYKYLKFIIEDKERFILDKSPGRPAITFHNIYHGEYKHKIDRILYNMDILFNITKNIVV